MSKHNKVCNVCGAKIPDGQKYLCEACLEIQDVGNLRLVALMRDEVKDKDKQIAELKSEEKDWMELSREFQEQGGCPECFADEGHTSTCTYKALMVNIGSLESELGTSLPEGRIRNRVDETLDKADILIADARNLLSKGVSITVDSIIPFKLVIKPNLCD